ncbi:alpha/beta hydrolase family protein [Chitinophaga ginsengisoli]|uniref:PGAP1-like protein n=1 Tax=Chitinophaga ginsengisoli TaxID=363837 RepID=A0A2P8G350_9BACT|nr:hypothetical protein [Chitinophaga ginsengisoli]PSL28356.1 hypothetical protein CLV42_108277 [Chitinophaga ginsengisoli]
MPKILAVHGIGQQFKGDAVIHDEWWPYLLSGVHKAGGELNPLDLVCPFYGDLFRRGDHLGPDPIYRPEDLNEEEIHLLENLWEEAAKIEPGKVPSKSDFEGEYLSSTPQWIQRALNSLSKSKFFVRLSQNMMMGDLKQVISYMNNKDIHDAIINRVLEKLTADVKIVIGHSLGSVVAYESLFRNDHNVVCFITMGSPLGIRNLIFDKLNPRPTKGQGLVPPVDSWLNVADKGDVVALDKTLSGLFGNRVRDLIVNNGSDAHSGQHYLSTSQIGKIITKNL